jgi:hypothetical protein
MPRGVRSRADERNTEDERGDGADRNLGTAGARPSTLDPRLAGHAPTMRDGDETPM